MPSEGKASAYLTYQEVRTLLSYVREHDPIVVGGQAIQIYSTMYRDFDPFLLDPANLSSEDLDFLENPRAAEALFRKLENGTLHKPAADDHTPNASKVTGKLNGRFIEIDFMRSVRGVDSKEIVKKALTFRDSRDTDVRITLIHPIDCARSRLANVNELRRTDDHSILQAAASVAILKAFIGQRLSAGNLKHGEITDIARQLEYIVTQRHYGRPSHLDFGDVLRPQDILDALMANDRLDARWKEMTLSGMISRCKTKEAVELERYRSFHASPSIQF